MYSEKIMNIFANPKNVGVLQSASGIGIFESENATDVIKLYIKVENNYIVDSTFKVFSGILGVAVLSILTEMIKNKSIETASQIEEKDIVTELGNLDENDNLFVSHSIDALKLAITDYQKKLEKEKDKK